MPYCRNCGTKLVDGAKFCQKCGHQVTDGNNISQPKQEYAGKIYKCPNCGEVLKSFEINCPACGFELRDVHSASAVREFALKLEAIESRRESDKPKRFFSNSNSSDYGLVEGFKESAEPGLKQLRESISEFNETINEAKDTLNAQE